MKCKECGRDEIPAGAAYCCWCGKKIIKIRRQKAEIKVPEPKHLESGNWFIKMMVDGEYQYVTEPTKELCIEKARAIKSGLLKVDKRDRETLGVLIDKYIASNSNVLSPSTIRGYDVIRRNRFRSYMDVPIYKIDWQKMINEEAPLCSAKTLKNAWALVAAALSAHHANVPKINMPQVIKSERPYFTPDEITKFVKAVHGHPIELAALLGLHGLRRSEMCALTWDDIDFEKKKIRVNGAAVPDKNNKIIIKKENKTSASRRDVPIMIPELLDALNAVDDKTGLIITCTPNNIYIRINSICEKAGLPKVGVHGLRHSFASLGFHLGVEKEFIQKWGGWSDPKTVSEIYTHLYNADIAKNREKIEKFYSA